MSRLFKYSTLIDFDSGQHGNPFIPGDPGWQEYKTLHFTEITGWEVEWRHPAAAGSYDIAPGTPYWNAWQASYDAGHIGAPPPSTPIHVTYDYPAGVVTNPTFGMGTINYYVEHPGYDPVQAVDYVPPTYTYDDHAGWNAGARSIQSFDDNGKYQFRVPTNITGAITGLQDADVDAAYGNINFAFQFSGPGNQFRVMENGVPKTEFKPFSETNNQFTIARTEGFVRYHWEKVQVYVSAVRSTGTLFADASLYKGGDYIYDAYMSETVDADFTGDVIEYGIGADISNDDTLLVERAIATDVPTAIVGDELGVVSDIILQDESLLDAALASEEFIFEVHSTIHNVVESATGATAFMEDESLVERGVGSDRMSDYTDTENAALVSVVVEMGEVSDMLTDQGVRGMLLEEHGLATAVPGSDGEDSGGEGFTDFVLEGAVGSDASVVERSVVMAEYGVASVQLQSASGFVNDVEEQALAADKTLLVVVQPVVEHGTASLQLAHVETSTLVEQGTGHIDVVIASSLSNTYVDGAIGSAMLTSSVSNFVVEGGTGSDTYEHEYIFNNNVLEGGTGSDVVSLLVTSGVREQGTALEYIAQSAIMQQAPVVEYAFGMDYLQGGGKAGAWTAPLETFAMSRYTNTPYQSLAVVDGVLLGASEDGVDRLDADNDNGADIEASVVHDWDDKVLDRRAELTSSVYKKHRRFLYLGAETTGPMSLTLGYTAKSGKEAFAKYAILTKNTESMATGRAILGRGIESRFLQATLNNEQGANFDIADAKLIVDETNRRT